LTASAAPHRPAVPGRSQYATTKHALVRHTRVLDDERCAACRCARVRHPSGATYAYRPCVDGNQVFGSYRRAGVHRAGAAFVVASAP
jgi:hypothetical protein